MDENEDKKVAVNVILLELYFLNRGLTEYNILLALG